MNPSHRTTTGTRLGARATTVAKSARGRTSAAFTPLRVQGHGVDLTPETREYVARRLGTLLARFATAITSVSVRFRDISGPKGAPMRSCAISANVAGHGPALVTAAAREPREAFDTAASIMARTTARLLERKQKAHKAHKR